MWLGAVTGGMAGPVLGGMLGWRVQPAHFAERHGSIVIIAIGEPLVGAGAAARSSHPGIDLVAAVLLEFAVAAAFWLAYLGLYSIRPQQHLSARQSAQRAAVAHDAYSNLHLPTVAGVAPLPLHQPPAYHRVRLHRRYRLAVPLLALYGVPGRLGPGWPRWPSPVLGWRRRCPHYPWNRDTLGHLRPIYLAMVCVVSALLSGKGLLDARGTRPSRR